MQLHVGVHAQARAQAKGKPGLAHAGRGERQVVLLEHGFDQELCQAAVVVAEVIFDAVGLVQIGEEAVALVEELVRTNLEKERVVAKGAGGLDHVLSQCGRLVLPAKNVVRAHLPVKEVERLGVILIVHEEEEEVVALVHPGAARIPRQHVREAARASG